MSGRLTGETVSEVKLMERDKQEEMEQLSFDAAIRRLEEVVDRLEQGDIPLEESIALFQEGMQLSRLCHEKLAVVSHKIEVLVKENQEWQVRPYREEEAD